MKRAVFIFALIFCVLMAHHGFAYENIANHENWKKSVYVDRMDDSKIITLLTTHVATMRYKEKEFKPSLYISFNNKKIDAIFLWDTDIIHENKEVMVRLDKEKAKTLYSENIINNKATRISNPMDFLKMMYGHKKLLVRVSPLNFMQLLAEFDISGIEEIAEPILKECGWK